MTDYSLTDVGDPEDAYDASDPAGERLRNFNRRINWIVDHLDATDLPAIALRLERLTDDIEYLRHELDP